MRSGSVGPPDPGRGCPELVKPILLKDIGVCMMQHPSGRASQVEIHGREASSPLPLLTRWVPLGEVLGYLVGYRSSSVEAWGHGTHGLGSRTSRMVKIWDLVVLGNVHLGLARSTALAGLQKAAVDGLGKTPAAGGYTLTGRRLVDDILGEAVAEC
jgi:hypothetical protein